MVKHKHGEWRQPANLIAGGAALMSLLSLVVSIRSCVISDRSAELARHDFSSRRLLVLGGTVAADNRSIALKPQDPAMTLQQARVLLPTTVTKTEWDVLPPERDLPVVGFRFELEKLVEARVPRKAGFASVAIQANLPVAIVSLYTTSGQAFEDRSIYRIMFSFVIDGDSSSPPKIEYKGIVFVERLGAETDARRHLDALWAQLETETSASKPGDGPVVE